MNKYNNNNSNFSRAPSGDSPIRFNKRPRYGANNSGGNNAARYKHQMGYQYPPPNRNNATDLYQSQPYDNGPPPRNFYGISPKRPNYNNNQQNISKLSPSYLHKTTNSATSSPSSSSFSANAKNILPPTQPPPMASTSMSAQNNQQQPQHHHHQQPPLHMQDNSNLYGFGYNSFYPTSFNNDLVPTDSTSRYGVTDALTPFMWQTITSTPPPKLPPQPPLPKTQPPSVLPPLPSDDKSSHLPPMAASSMSPTKSSTTSGKFDSKNKKSNDKESAAKTIIKMKTKRKAMSTRYKVSKSWSEEDAILALQAEETNTKKLQTDTILVIRFPDPELSREIVKCYSPDIESVHFQLNCAPRYCLVHLKPGTDVEKTIDHLSKVPFGTGFLSVEIKQIPYKVHSTKLNEVDPYTLYVGNLPTSIACKTLKNHFPGAARIDIGFAQRMKYTRYAFIRYLTVQKAIEAYNRMLESEIGGRTLTIRFRRLTTSSDANKDGDADNDDDLINQTTIESEDKTVDENVDDLQNELQENSTAEFVEHNSHNDRVEKEVTKDLETNTESRVEKPLETDDNNSASPTSAAAIPSTNQDIPNSSKLNSPAEKNSEAESSNSVILKPPPVSTSQANNSNSQLLNIKPEPDIDPDDIVIRDNALTSRVELTNDNIKQEEQLAIYMEFFAPPANQNQTNKENARKSISNDIVSLPSTADETDTMSTVSNNSLGEFLQNCQRSQTQSSCIENIRPPPAKRNKPSEDNLPATIKQEILESNNIETATSSIAVDNIKQEPMEDRKNVNVSDKNTSITDSVNKKVPRKRDRVQTATSAPTSSPNNDDVVPSTALFFRSNSQTTLNLPSNDSDYDEFYDTRTNVSSQTTTTSVGNIKKEPLDISAKRSTNERCENIQESTISNTRSSVNAESKINQPRSISNTVTASNTVFDEDDLVPAQNLLGSYQPFRSEIKQEMEHDDIFAVPINKTNNLSETSNLGNLRNETVSNLTSVSDKNATITENANRSTMCKDNDDDVIIISDNISPQAKQTNSNTHLLNNLIFRRHTDLVTVTSKTIAAVTIPKREVSNLIHHDNLDKLYEELDADSDIEL